jgi:ribokinase
VRVAVVGHVEWVEFLRLERVPRAGEIVYAESRPAVPAGGGGVAAVQLARWAGACTLFTALGDDELGHRTAAGLRARGVDVHAVFRTGTAQRRAITFVDAQRERTITVVGERLAPHAADPLPWADLSTYDAVYLTAGDPDAVRAARAARVLVATSRVIPLLAAAAVPLDALVGSAVDADERYLPGMIAPEPAVVVRTDGARGGTYTLAGTTHHYAAATAAVTGDTYGAGDSFAAALTLALATGARIADALAVAAARAAEVVTYDGPYPPP